VEGKVDGIPDGSKDGNNEGVSDGEFDEGTFDAGINEPVGDADGKAVGSKGNRLQVVGQKVIPVTSSGIENWQSAGAPPLAITKPA
jgi:hypothetical protein